MTDFQLAVVLTVAPLAAVLVLTALVEAAVLVREWALSAVSRRRARTLRIEAPGPHSAMERHDGRWT